MAERKHKRGSEDITELDEDASISLEPTQIELGSGYTLAVRYDENERPLVDIKTYGQVDLARLRREIEGAFPHAQIRQEKQSQTVIVAKKNKRKLGKARKRSR
ncbi:MAG TPA: hypothetical protein VMT42_00635 [candidate division Zixibacteria bacterium]|jgi:hypothetical protein|nr:hypothetical protein [candidate division Zixibacteria bacterium]